MVSERRKTEERRGTGFSVLVAQIWNESQKLPALLLATFFAWSFTFVPRSLFRDRKGNACYAG